MQEPLLSFNCFSAWQVLIAAHQPAYAVRYNQMENLFLAATDIYGAVPSQDTLRKLILSETSIYDVLHSFFYHNQLEVRKAALEVGFGGLA